MINMQAEFYSGHKGQLFRLIRTPASVNGHLLFVAPLFEQANNTRHMVTKAAIASYDSGYQSIVFDHYGTGDSQGQLADASLSVWQQDIIKQIGELRQISDKPITLSLSLSAALLLTDDMLAMVDSVQLWQPELNGKRFVQQFKRLALAKDLQKAKPNSTDTCTSSLMTIAGYTMTHSLLDELAKQVLGHISQCQADVEWLEWLAANTELTQGRQKQYYALQQACAKQIQLTTLSDEKFWLATELLVSQQLLTYLHGAFAINAQCGAEYD